MPSLRDYSPEASVQNILRSCRGLYRAEVKWAVKDARSIRGFYGPRGQRNSQEPAPKSDGTGCIVEAL